MLFSPLPATTSSFLPLLVVIALAAFVPLLLGRFRGLTLPIMVGEILGGMIVGKSGLNWVPQHDPALELLAEFGFVFLMFLAGMEVDLTSLGMNAAVQGGASRRGDHPLVLAGLHFLATLALAAAVAFVIWRMGLARDLPLMALILSTTSLGVVVPVLKETGLIGGRYGQTLLLSALIADFVTMLLITVEVAVVAHGLTLDILLITGLFVVLFVFYRLGTWVVPVLSPLIEEMSHATAQAKMRLSFFLMFFFVVVAEFLGVEVILGAFLAGLLVALLLDPDDHALMHQLEATGYGFFIPIFFIMVGVRFDFGVVFGSLQAIELVGFLLVGAVLVKGVPALLFRRVFSWRESLAAGTLLSARLSLIIAAAQIGQDLGMLSDTVVMAVILVAMITVTVAPIAFARLMGGQKTTTARRPIAVAGAGTVGIQVAETLRGHGEAVVLLDPDATRVARARSRGLEVHLAVTPEALEAHLGRSRALVCAHSDEDEALKVCQVARGTLGMDPVIALAPGPTAAKRLRAMGVRVYSPTVLLAHMLTLLVRNPDFVHLLTATDDTRDVCECFIENPRLAGRRLRDLPLPPDVLVLSIRRGDAFIIPHGNTRLELGDHMTLLGSLNGLEAAIQELNLQ